MGTSLQTTGRDPNSPAYGSFGNTNLNLITHRGKNNNEQIQEDMDVVEDNDSGMSSEENEDSIKHNISPENNDNVIKNISSILDDNREIITKCLADEAQCSERRNEIPSCSNDYHSVSVIIENDKNRLHLDNSDDVVNENTVPEFIVIDLTCDIDNVDELHDGVNKLVGTNECDIDCDPTVLSSAERQSLVPIVNNEIANTENQKLLSLSLSILLAALLQAMRCFAQFLEDIVVPQRL